MSVSDPGLFLEELPLYKPRQLWWRRWSRQAAVAAVLRQTPLSDSAEVLLIKRSEHPLDPWSGHMAFPGGRRELNDPTLASTAERELQEEIGLEIAVHGSPFGRLSDIMARPIRWRRRPLIVTPFVYQLTREPPPFRLDPAEVADLTWVPLQFLADRKNRSTMTWERRGIQITLPCYQFGSYRIWGLTLRMLDELLQVVTLP